MKVISIALKDKGYSEKYGGRKTYCQDSELTLENGETVNYTITSFRKKDMPWMVGEVAKGNVVIEDGGIYVDI